jgi:hypothetical protein
VYKEIEKIDTHIKALQNPSKKNKTNGKIKTSENMPVLLDDLMARHDTLKARAALLYQQSSGRVPKRHFTNTNNETPLSSATPMFPMADHGTFHYNSVSNLFIISQCFITIFTRLYRAMMERLGPCQLLVTSLHPPI